MVEEGGCLRQTGGVVPSNTATCIGGIPTGPTYANAVTTGGTVIAGVAVPAAAAGTGTAANVNANPHIMNTPSTMNMLNMKPGNTGGRYLWTDRELLMHLQNYTPLILLIDFVEKTRTKRFYESSERYEILMLVFIMRKGAPFCENKRFPTEYWVNLSVGAIAEAFDRLQAAIDIPDPQLPIHMSVTDLTSWKQMFDAAMLDIRRYAYHTDPMQLADVGVYNRYTFEQRFGMQWQE